MKKILQLLSFLVIIAFITSGCFQDERSDPDPEKLLSISINPNNRISPHIDSVGGNLRFIKLETQNDFVIPRVNGIFFAENRIFIYDYISSNSVYCFDTIGKHLFTIRPEGRGPEEIGHITDFNVSHDKSSTYVHDNSKHKVYNLDMDGKIINQRAYKENFYPFKGFAINSDYFVYHLNHTNFSDYNLIIGNVDLSKIIKSLVPYKYSTDDISSTFILGDNDDILYSYGLIDTIYRIKSRTMKLSPLYVIDFGRWSVPSSIKSSENSRAVMSSLHDNKGKYSYLVYLRGESSKHLVFSYIFSSGVNFNFFIYNKKKKQGGSMEYFRTDLEEIHIGGPIGYHKESDSFVSLIESHNLKIYNYLNKASGNYGVYHNLLNLIEATNSFDNPVLALYKIK